MNRTGELTVTDEIDCMVYTFVDTDTETADHRADRWTDTGVATYVLARPMTPQDTVTISLDDLGDAIGPVPRTAFR